MLEIILVVFLTKRLARFAEAKGHSKNWGALAALFWIAGEILGLVIGVALEIEDLGVYGFALLGAGAGAAAAFAIVAALGSRESSFQLAMSEPIGHFDPSNPYSPPGTYPR